MDVGCHVLDLLFLVLMSGPTQKNQSQQYREHPPSIWSTSFPSSWLASNLHMVHHRHSFVSDDTYGHVGLDDRRTRHTVSRPQFSSWSFLRFERTNERCRKLFSWHPPFFSFVVYTTLSRVVIEKEYWFLDVVETKNRIVLYRIEYKQTNKNLSWVLFFLSRFLTYNSLSGRGGGRMGLIDCVRVKKLDSILASNIA